MQSLGSRPDAMIASRKNLNIQFLFQCTDRAGQIGLRHKKPFGCLRNRAGSADLKNIFDLLNGHSWPPVIEKKDVGI